MTMLQIFMKPSSTSRTISDECALPRVDTILLNTLKHNNDDDDDDDDNDKRIACELATTATNEGKRAPNKGRRVPDEVES